MPPFGTAVRGSDHCRRHLKQRKQSMHGIWMCRLKVRRRASSPPQRRQKEVVGFVGGRGFDSMGLDCSKSHARHCCATLSPLRERSGRPGTARWARRGTLLHWMAFTSGWERGKHPGRQPPSMKVTESNSRVGDQGEECCWKV
jgi:hypothetical protein